MEIDRFCSVCNDEASMFCRMCSTHYCPDHLCLHLNVAWETNTWTERNKYENENNVIDEIKIPNNMELRANNYTNTIQSNEKSLLSYTETQLQAQLNFYISQSRRIKRELERRLLPVEGFSFSSQKQLYPRARRKRTERDIRVFTGTIPGISKKDKKALQILSNALRTNNISIADIEKITGVKAQTPLS